MPDTATVSLVDRGDGDYDLKVGDLFDLTMSYDADDDRWYLWCLRSRRVQPDGSTEVIYAKGDDRNGEPLPMSALTDWLAAASEREEN